MPPNRTPKYVFGDVKPDLSTPVSNQDSDTFNTREIIIK
jgi:hypothetical protein